MSKVIKKGFLRFIALLVSFSLLCPVSLSQTVFAAGTSKSQHELPVLSTVPKSNDNLVEVDSEIQINIDTEAKTFTRFRNQLEKGNYKAYLNGVQVESTYDEKNHTIFLSDYQLKSQTTYTVNILIKADSQNNDNKSQNSSFKFTFITKLDNSNAYIKVLKDNEGNLYKISGNETTVKSVFVQPDTETLIEDLINTEYTTPLVTKPVKFSIPQELNNTSPVNVKVKYAVLPDRVMKVDKENNLLVWVPFYNDNETLYSNFEINESSIILPVKYKDDGGSPQTTPTASIKTSRHIYNSLYNNLSIEPYNKYETNSMFNILENKDGYLRVKLNYFLSHPLTSNSLVREKLLYQVLKNGTYIVGTSISGEPVNNDMTIICNNLESGVYTFKISKRVITESEDQVRFSSELIWEQDVFVENTNWDSQIVNIAEKYAPILAFHKDEKFFPINLDQLFNHNLDYDWGIPIDDSASSKIKVSTITGGENITLKGLGDFMSYNGNKYYNLNMKNTAREVVGSLNNRYFQGSKDNVTVYYSWFRRNVQGVSKLFLNYHFFYAFDPKDGSPETPHWTAHNFDRESITIVFNDGYNPEKVIYSGHLEDQKMGLADGDFIAQSWGTGAADRSSKDGGRVCVNIKDVISLNNRPIVSVAKGSHALYPITGTYKFGYAVGDGIVGGKEEAGIIDLPSSYANLLEGNPDNVKNLVGPNRNEFNNNLNEYKLIDLKLNNITSNNAVNRYLAFSGKWITYDALDKVNVDRVNFTPFTIKETDIAKWTETINVWNPLKIPVKSQTDSWLLKTYLSYHSLYKPENFETVINSQANGVNLSWNKVQSAEGYIIHRKPVADGAIIYADPEYIINGCDNTSFVDAEFAGFEKYTYYITPFKKIKDVAINRDTIKEFRFYGLDANVVEGPNSVVKEIAIPLVKWENKNTGPINAVVGDIKALQGQLTAGNKIIEKVTVNIEGIPELNFSQSYINNSSSFDLSKVRIDTSNQYIRKTGSYNIRVWAKLAGYPGPERPVGTVVLNVTPRITLSGFNVPMNVVQGMQVNLSGYLESTSKITSIRIGVPGWYDNIAECCPNNTWYDLSKISIDTSKFERLAKFPGAYDINIRAEFEDYIANYELGRTVLTVNPFATINYEEPIEIVKGITGSLRGSIQSHAIIEKVTVNIANVTNSYKEYYPGTYNFDLSRVDINTSSSIFEPGKSYKLNIWVKAQGYDSKLLGSITVNVIPRGITISGFNGTFEVTQGGIFELPGTLSSDTLITTVTVGVIGWFDKYATCNPNSYNFNLNYFKIDTSKFPFTNPGPYDINIWAKSVGNPNPVNELGRIRMVVKDAEIRDIIRPTVVSVAIIDNYHIRVKFSEDVHSAYATNKYNYTLTDSRGIAQTIKGISIYNIDDTYTIETLNPLTGSSYTLKIKNIIDKAQPSNVMEEFTTVLIPNQSQPSVPQFFNGVTITRYDAYFNVKINRNALPESMKQFTQISVCGVNNISDSNIQNVINQTVQYGYGLQTYNDDTGYNEHNSAPYDLIMLFDSSRNPLGYYILYI